MFHRCDIISPLHLTIRPPGRSTGPQTGLLLGAYNIHLLAENQVLPLRTWQKIQRQPLGRPRWSVAPGWQTLVLGPILQHSTDFSVNLSFPATCGCHRTLPLHPLQALSMLAAQQRQPWLSVRCEGSANKTSEWVKGCGTELHTTNCLDTSSLFLSGERATAGLKSMPERACAGRSSLYICIA